MIGRIDQAVLLLQDRLQRLAAKGDARSSSVKGAGAPTQDPIEQLRALRQRGDLDPDELRRAFVRTLLVGTLGDGLAATLDFQAVADQVSDILSENEVGRNLVDRALIDLGLS
eukprot:gene19411-19829_t